MAAEMAVGDHHGLEGTAVTDRRAPIAVFLATAKRALRSAVLWGFLFGGLIANEALSYQGAFPTLQSRRQFAEAFGANGGLAAVAGKGRQLNTIEGFVAWRVFGLLIIVGAIWGLLAATRLLRGEEDAGRWELLLAGRTTRRHATGQGIAGLAAGFLVLWTVTAALTVAAGLGESVGFSVSASLFYATAATASAPVFLSIGALASQLAPTRRQANSLAAAIFGVSLLIRMAADTVDGLDWMRWASPLGWIENLRPLTGSRPLALLPIILLTVAGAWGAIIMAGRRDVGTGTLARQQPAQANLRLLGGPTGLVVRLERWVALGWTLGLALLAVVFGVVAGSAAEADLASDVEEAVGRLGGNQGGAVAWIGYEFMYLAALAAFAVAGQISAARSQEASGHLDNLLARRVGRGRWLGGHLAVAATLAVLIGLSTGVGGWLGLVASGAGDVGLVTMLEAGLNVMVPALFVLGVGTLLFGLAPRPAVPLIYTFILWSFVIVIIGPSISTNHWFLDTALLTHLGPVPATGLHWAAIGWMAGIGGIAAVAGIAAFDRRDLAGA